MAWNVNSVVLRPLRPASNFIVGVQRPKSRPEMVDLAVVELLDEEEELVEIEVVVLASRGVGILDGKAAADVAAAAALVTVISVVPPQATGLKEDAARAATATLETFAPAEPVVEFEAVEFAAEELAVEFEAEVPDAPGAPAGVPLFPAASVVVKFEKPCATITSATLNPSAVNGVEILDLLFAFSLSLPPTAGSIKGTTPRRAAVVGNVGSEQIFGTEATKGLKFCSAATRPRAAEVTAGSLPSCATMASAWVSFPQGFAAARRNWMEFPARVAAAPEVPKLLRALMADMAPFPCS